MSPERLHCCWLGRNGESCGDTAEWEVWDGIQPYFDHYVHACTEHVGALLTDQPEHRVYRIATTRSDVPRHAAPGSSRSSPGSGDEGRLREAMEDAKSLIESARLLALHNGNRSSEEAFEKGIARIDRALSPPKCSGFQCAKGGACPKCSPEDTSPVSVPAPGDGALRGALAALVKECRKFGLHGIVLMAAEHALDASPGAPGTNSSKEG